MIFINNVNYISPCFLDLLTVKYQMMESDYAYFMLQNCLCSTNTDSTLSLEGSIKNLGENQMLNLIMTSENRSIQEYMT